eukprot:TRINITY_DN2082_c0_g1_i2.p1 TRINITY_DN2082_c0_g1~~TRINITY_DN2082_c0_g1_i2.p1  ORF type:complete len:592 (-),score=136.57 TRINITY_DN2082_c0_g1_i2:30-1805(-)
MMENLAPIFTPTMEEFKDFSAYVTSIQHLCTNGICKIIPPKEWNEKFTYDDKLNSMSIPSPIKQHVSGDKGVYQLMLVESKKMTVKGFKDLANKEKMQKSSRNENYDSVERLFWKNVRFNPPTYGADMAGSLLDANGVETWNMSRLDSILNVVLGDIKLAGINTPYLYFGMWKAMFAWHVEDMNLFSINYLHFGEPKYWYAVSPQDGPRLERLAQSYFPEQFRKCSEFLRHKTTMISPHILQRNNIKVTNVKQEAGQIVITFPYSYHCGFNYGFNCAESVNFALESWLDYGKKATNCKCVKDTVAIDMPLFQYYYDYWKTHGNFDGLAEVATAMAATVPAEDPTKFHGEQQPTENISGNISGNIVSENISPDISMNIHDNISMNIVENIQEKIQENIPQNIPDFVDIEAEFSRPEENFLGNFAEIPPTYPPLQIPPIHLPNMEMSFPQLSQTNRNQLENKRKREINLKTEPEEEKTTPIKKKIKKLTKEDEQILEEYSVKFHGTVPDKKTRDSIAQQLNWSTSGVYGWFKRRWNAKQVDAFNSQRSLSFNMDKFTTPVFSPFMVYPIRNNSIQVETYQKWKQENFVHPGPL